MPQIKIFFVFLRHGKKENHNYRTRSACIRRVAGYRQQRAGIAETDGGEDCLPEHIHLINTTPSKIRVKANSAGRTACLPP